MKTPIRFLAFVLAVAGSTNVSSGDTPSADYIFPAGGQRGTTVEFRVGAHFLHGGAPFEMQGGGIEASSRIEQTETIWFEGPMIFKPASQGGENYPKDHLGTVKIAPDAEPGVRYWRLWTSQGAVGGRQFIIGDLPEVVEEEIDGRPIPVKVELPVTINGRMFPREDIDIWEFDAEAGQSITCEVVASRLGSPLDSRVEVRGPNGRRIAENTDHFGSDSFLRFTVPETGTYHLHIYDSSYRGLQQFVYRLTVTAGTYIDRVFPLGGRAGSKVKFELAGQHASDRNIEVELPSQAPGVHLQRFPLGNSLSNPVLIDLSDLDEHLEAEPNDEPGGDNAIAIPAVLNGRMEKPGDVDCWTITANKDQKFEFDLATVRHGSLLDAVLTISDVSGKQLVQIGSTENNPVEPMTSFTIPEDGAYIVRVHEFLQRGGPEYAYRLNISEPPTPDFRVRLPGDALTLYRGGEVKSKVSVERRVGFAGEIALSVHGLPGDVTVTGTTIPADKKDVELVFKADEKAKIRTAHLTIEGTATINEEQRTHRATLPGPRGSKDRDDVFLAVSMPTPFKLDGVAFQTGYAARGTIHRRHYVIHRNSFTGPLTAALADRQIRHQQGVTGPTIQLPGEATEFQYPIRVPTWLEMNRTGRVVVMAVGEVEDEDGVKHKVSYSSTAVNDQIIILTAPSLMSVRAVRTSVRAESGKTFDLGIQVARGVLKPAPVKIELLLPKHMRGIEAEPITIPTDKNAGSFSIRFGETFGPFNMPVVIRATTIRAGDPVIAETELEFVAHPSFKP
ncbi:MAG: hypothetical protein CMJ64_27250 [Planctomycetaceae bacterium]|nr:hypothetical protein [Planctomycetaceae bacterium]